MRELIFICLTEKKSYYVVTLFVCPSVSLLFDSAPYRLRRLKDFLLNFDQIFAKQDDVPASVAQLDARTTGDLEVAGSIPAGSATFFRGD